MDVRDVVERELIPFRPVLVDVGDGQAGQLLHGLVVTGNRSQLHGGEAWVPDAQTEGLNREQVE